MDATTLVDARWAHHAGATTFTRSLLRGLADVQPPGRWLLWGPSSMVERLWPGARHVPTSVNPAAWFGQQSVLRVPRADVVLHPHQTRPFHRLPAATCVLDLIQLQHPSPVIRAMKAARLRASVRAARVLFTIASSVREELVDRFDVDPASIFVVPVPVDRDAAARVAARRTGHQPERYVLGLGRFDRHKNLPRLIEAFAGTRFAAHGGRLLLAGGTIGELRALGVDPVPPGVRVLGVLETGQLEDVMARATAVVQASLAEGFGLPVAEALAACVPVLSSPVPAVTEFGPPGVPTFDPWTTRSICDAIDETVRAVDAGRYWELVDRDHWLATLPTVRALAEEVLHGLATVAAEDRSASKGQ